MNVESLAIDNEDTLNTHKSADSVVEPNTELTPLGLEFLKLVGGGGAIVGD